MSFSAPPGRPSITATVSSSFRDGYALAKTNATPSMIVLIIGFIGALATLATGWKPAATTSPVALDAIVIPLYIMMLVLSYYALAASVRTVYAQYRMTAGQFLGFIGYGLLAALLTALAAVAFVIPAYWVGVKVLLTPYTYVVTNGAPGALKRTWNMTTGYYWQTVGLLLLAAFGFCALLYAASAICVLAAYLAAPTLIFFGPLMLAVFIWLLHVHALIYIRWTDGLLPRANAPQSAVPVPA